MKGFIGKIALALACAVLAGAVLFAFGGCKKKDEAPSGEGGFALTDAQTERIKELAEAFYEFGPFDMDAGIDISKIERFIWCMYAHKLDESAFSGYGRVALDETDEMIDSVFKGIKIHDKIRTKYDITKDQELFLLNDYYYVKLPDTSAPEAKIVSAEPLTDDGGNIIGVIAKAEVTCGGNKCLLTMKLYNSDVKEYYAGSCSAEDLI